MIANSEIHFFSEELIPQENFDRIHIFSEENIELYDFLFLNELEKAFYA